jgi:hypothetical protein
LRAELLNDPLSLGYSQFIDVRNDIECLNALNAVREGQDFLVSRGRLTKDAFIEVTSFMLFNLLQLSHDGNENAEFWIRVFNTLVANSDTISVSDPTLIQILDQMITLNFLTSSDKDSILKRQGSRAEILFGTNVTLDQVSDSLNEG